MRLDGFYGNDTVKRLLAGTADASRFAHAFLIEGPVGSGRRTLAGLLAQAAVCTGEGEKPCGHCPGCRKAAAGAHPDVTRLSRQEDDKAFAVDNIRALRQKAFVLPNEAPRQVFILADVQQMQEAAQNALLKILEEPPATAVWILTCENRAQVLPTVLSRVTVLPLGGVPVDQAVQALQACFPGRPVQELRQAAELFGGVIGQAKQSLEGGGTKKVFDAVQAVAAGLLARDDFALVKAAGAFEKDKDTLRGVLTVLPRLLRDALALRFGCETLLSPFPETARQLAARLTREQLTALLTQVERLQADLEGYMNHALLLSVFCLRLRQAAGHGTAYIAGGKT
ncbi:MAG: DNA polymerase III subunit delta [Clostridia bacterium]|nr:DNA polymerase III subunit delta [Clostridia bacterium]